MIFSILTDVQFLVIFLKLNSTVLVVRVFLGLRYIRAVYTAQKKPQIRSRSHKIDPTSLWDQSGSLLHPSKCVGSI
jgi:hypothetical protein